MIIKANSMHIPLKDESVHCVVTSPPYFGLRKYNIPDSIWDGQERCDHQWDEIVVPAANGIIHDGGMSGETLSGSSATRRPQKSRLCAKCGAWKGQLGGEPSISLYVSHLVQIFREVRRVLRKDGVLWLNMGDSYASGKGSCYNPGGGERSFGKHLKTAGVHPLRRTNISDLQRDGLKAKDLCEIPSEVVGALRDDGWWLRSRIPWVKQSGMPESVNDRPTVSLEYIFLLTKTARPFYDAQAVKIMASDDTHARYARGRSGRHKYADGGPGNQTIAKSFEHMRKPMNWRNSGPYHPKLKEHSGEYPDSPALPDNYRGSLPGRRDGPGQDRRSKKDRLPGVHPKSTEPGTGNRANSSFNAAVKDVVGSRYRRNADWFFESLRGLLTNQEGEPLAMLVNSRGYAGAHYSTFPEAVVEPCIKAGTSAKGCCPKCGAPWIRILEKSGGRDWRKDGVREIGIPGERIGQGTNTGGRPATSLDDTKEVRTVGWQPTCSCDAGDPVPCLVLDPFLGSGTVGAVAERLNRRWVGLDLGYQQLQRERLVGIQKEIPLIG